MYIWKNGEIIQLLFFSCTIKKRNKFNNKFLLFYVLLAILLFLIHENISIFHRNSKKFSFVCIEKINDVMQKEIKNGRWIAVSFNKNLIIPWMKIMLKWLMTLCFHQLGGGDKEPLHTRNASRSIDLNRRVLGSYIFIILKS